MELKDYIRIVRRRLPWFLGVFIAIVGGYSTAATWAAPPVYRAATQLVINPTRVPSAFQGLEVFFPGSLKMGFDTRVAGIRGRKVQMMAAEALVDLKDAAGAPLFPAASPEDLAARVARAYTVAPLGKTELVEIQVEADSPERAAAIANAVCEAAIAFNVQFDLKVLQEAQRKASDQLARNLAAMKALGERLKDFRRENDYSEFEGVPQLVARRSEMQRLRDQLLGQLYWMDKLDQGAAQREAEARRLEALRSARGDADPEVKETASRLALADRQHAEALHRVRSGVSSADGTGILAHLLERRGALHQACADLRTRQAEAERNLAALERRREMEAGPFLEYALAKDPGVSRLIAEREAAEQGLQGMLARYTEDHPQVKAARRSLTDLKRQMDLALSHFRAQADREHAYQRAVLGLDQAFLKDELARREAELDALDGDIARKEQGAFQLERTYLRGELARKDEEIAALDTRIRRIEGLRFDEQTLLEQQRQLEADNLLFSAFLAKSALITDAGAAGPIRPVERFEDPVLARDAWPAAPPVLPMVWFVAVIGLLGSLGVVFVVEYMDASLKTEHDVRRHMNLPVLGIVPKRGRGKPVLLPELPHRDEIVEVYQSSATLVRSAARDLGLKTLVVTSTLPREGKTTTSVNLAVALARKGVAVILVDADLRMPQVHEALGLPNDAGLSSFLSGEGAPGDFLRETRVPNLRVITSGPIPQDPMGLLESVRMKALVEELKGQAEFVVFDTPPVSSVGDTLTLATLSDAVLFVVGAGIADQRRVAWAKHLLSHIEARILGCILNHAALEAHGYYYYTAPSDSGKRHRA